MALKNRSITTICSGILCQALLLGAPCQIAAQGVACSPLDITLSTQAEVNNFQANHGPCEWLQFLSIEGDEIESLEGLRELRRVDFRLRISSTGLSNLEGLDNLEYIGDFGISRNLKLVSLNGFPAAMKSLDILGIGNNGILEDLTALSNLTRIGKLHIGSNQRLSSFSGLEQLIQAESIEIYENPSLVAIQGMSGLETISDYLSIIRNEALINLDGFYGLSSVRGVVIQSNDSLVGLDGLKGIGSLNYLFLYQNNAMKNLDGLSGLTTIEDVSISANAALKNIDGLSNLESIGHNLGITFNPQLAHLEGLSGITSVGFKLEIWGNETLSDIQGLAAMQSVGDLWVFDNPKLSDCSALVAIIDPIDDFDPGPGPGPYETKIPDIEFDATIGSNGDGCNSVNQILGQVPISWLNSGLNDAWFFRDTSGQGFFIIIFPGLKTVFLSWFTYDTERPPDDLVSNLGEPGHRWLTAQGLYDENVAILEIYLTSGGVFDAQEPAPVTEPDGVMTLEFTSCNSGTLNYDISSVDRQGEIPIERIVLDNVPLCYVQERLRTMGGTSR